MNGIEFAESGGGFNRVPGVCLLVPMPTSRPRRSRNPGFAQEPTQTGRNHPDCSILTSNVNDAVGILTPTPGFQLPGRRLGSNGTHGDLSR